MMVSPGLCCTDQLVDAVIGTARVKLKRLTIHPDARHEARRHAQAAGRRSGRAAAAGGRAAPGRADLRCDRRSEEHTSELQSRQYLVCRLLLEKKENRM